MSKVEKPVYEQKCRKFNGAQATYLLRNVPYDLWLAVRVKSVKENIPLRKVIVGLLKQWSSGKVVLDEMP